MEEDGKCTQFPSPKIRYPHTKIQMIEASETRPTPISTINGGIKGLGEYKTMKSC